MISWFRKKEARKVTAETEAPYSPVPLGEREPDVEVLFEFNGVRSRPTVSGYRPMHATPVGYLTSGEHRYYDTDSVPPMGSATGTITFLSPQAYTKALREGSKINIQEGSKTVGTATVLKVLNPMISAE